MGSQLTLNLHQKSFVYYPFTSLYPDKEGSKFKDEI